MDFQPFGVVHFVIFFASLTLGIFSIFWLKAEGNVDRQKKRARIAGFLILIPNAVLALQRFLPGHFDWMTSLPLDLCDLAWMVAGASLISGRRILRETSYYWGVGLSTQAFLTPTLTDGPQTLVFWDFWGSHWQIVTAAFAELLVFQLRPNWRSWASVCCLTFVCCAFVTGVNLSIGSNYFFTGSRTPSHPTMIDLLGPWPWRLVALLVIVVSWFALLTIPFIWRNRRRQGHRSEAAGRLN